MPKIARRALILGLGAYVVTREFLGRARPADAAHDVTDFEGIKRCVDEGGSVTTPLFVEDRHRGICVTGEDIARKTERDAACRREMGNDEAKYHPYTKECTTAREISLDNIGGGGGGGCFLTTCCAEHIGVTDNCFELRTLRMFRDGPLQTLPGGKQAIAAYYAMSPDIVEALNALPEREQELSRLYLVCVFPSAVAAALGWSRLAFWIYRRAFFGLSRRLASRKAFVGSSRRNFGRLWR